MQVDSPVLGPPHTCGGLNLGGHPERCDKLFAVTIAVTFSPIEPKVCEN